MKLINLILSGTAAIETKPWHVVLGLFLFTILAYMVVTVVIWFFRKIFRR